MNGVENGAKENGVRVTSNTDFSDATSGPYLTHSVSMPRPPRFVLPGFPHHVAETNARKCSLDEDRTLYLELCGNSLPVGGFSGQGALKSQLSRTRPISKDTPRACPVQPARNRAN